MKKLFVTILMVSAGLTGLEAQQLTILHTNDTHSHIDTEKGVGGVLQRQALIDSVRAADKNVLLIDAGDAVQGSLYFNLFKGAVEYPLMDLMGYDVQILGNHEFDNGLESLARYFPNLKSARLSANYDFTGTPLEGVFQPYVIREFDGKKVGIFGINLNPEGIIADSNYKGMGFSDIISTANKTADYLRDKKHCDLVVMVSHIGYDNDGNPNLVTDPEVARASKNIDIIVGGHSHTLVDPAAENPLSSRFKNRDGKEVLVVQTGRYGGSLGEIKVDLKKPRKAQYSLLPVRNVDPKRFDPRIVEFLKPYRHEIDSIMVRPVAVSAADMKNTKQYATSAAITNLSCDMAQWYGNLKLDSLSRAGQKLPSRSDLKFPSRSDLAVMNSGGVRMPWAKGVVTEGQVLSTFPFPNKFVVVEMDGRSLAELLAQIAELGSQGVSAEVRIAFDSASKKAEGFTVSGEPVSPDRLYYVTTIDYLATGGDYLTAFKKGRIVWTDTDDMCAPVMRYVTDQTGQHLPLGTDPSPRIVPAISLPEE